MTRTTRRAALGRPAPIRLGTNPLVSIGLLAVGTLSLAACGGPPPAKAGGDGAVQVTASDKGCKVSRTELPAGRHVFAITNTGSQVTEVYLYGAGNAIVAEKENIGPGLRYELTAQVPTGSYQVVCKPGQTGDGIRTALTVSGGAAQASDPKAEQAVAAYRAYVQQQADALVPLVANFTAAVKAGDGARAKALYAPSRAPWEAVEPVAESFGDLDPKIDLREADLEPGQEWTGWHRLEKALWVDGTTTGMATVADQLVTDIGTLRTRVASAEISPASIGNGAKELLDEVASRKVTGEEEAFSHTDLVDVVGNVAGARKAYEVLRPLVQDQTELTARIDAAFADVDRVLAGHARAAARPATPPAAATAPAGTVDYASYDTVDDAGRRELARVVDALGEPLSELASAATT